MDRKSISEEVLDDFEDALSNRGLPECTIQIVIDAVKKGKRNLIQNELCQNLGVNDENKEHSH